MNEYTLLQSAVNTIDVAQIKSVCLQQFAQSTLIPNGYPGITLKDKTVCEHLAQFIPDGIIYDYSFGTGANYVHTPKGWFLGKHTDKPLYELDENYHLKPEYENRVCVVTVIACLDGAATIRVTPQENIHEDISVSVGDVLILRGTLHELLPVEVDLASFACGFYCTDA